MKRKKETKEENCEKRKRMKKQKRNWKGERKGGEQGRAGKEQGNTRGKRGRKREEVLPAKFSFPNKPIAHRPAKVERNMIASRSAEGLSLHKGLKAPGKRRNKIGTKSSFNLPTQPRVELASPPFPVCLHAIDLVVEVFKLWPVSFKTVLMSQQFLYKI